MSPNLFKTGSLCTCIKQYKLFGIVWLLSAWLKWNYFNVMIMMMVMRLLDLQLNIIK